VGVIRSGRKALDKGVITQKTDFKREVNLGLGNSCGKQKQGSALLQSFCHKITLMLYTVNHRITEQFVLGGTFRHTVSPFHESK